jgi:hypothetical protein
VALFVGLAFAASAQPFPPPRPDASRQAAPAPFAFPDAPLVAPLVAPLPNGAISEPPKVEPPPPPPPVSVAQPGVPVGEAPMAPPPAAAVQAAPEAREEPSASWTVFGIDFRPGELILIVVAALLLLATLGLWLAARTLAWQAGRAAHRHLRGYVAHSEGGFTSDGSSVTGRMEFKNFGQTPLYGLRSTMMIDVADSGAPPFGRLARSKGDGQIIAPGAAIVVEANKDLWPEELEALRDGQKAIYLWGRIDYLDAFKKRRWFTFHRQSGKRHFVDGEERWPIVPAPGGDKAN